MLVFRCVLNIQVKTREYSVCESGAQTGHTVGMMSIFIDGKKRDWLWSPVMVTGYRFEREGTLK